MRWVHGTWQCPRCRFKLGCCEGEPQTSCEPPKARGRARSPDEAARRLADGQPFSHVGGLVAAEAFVGVVWGVLGYTAIRTLEWQSRIHATLERA